MNLMNPILNEKWSKFIEKKMIELQMSLCTKYTAYIRIKNTLWKSINKPVRSGQRN